MTPRAGSPSPNPPFANLLVDPLAALGVRRRSAPRLRRGPRRGGGALRASAHRMVLALAWSSSAVLRRALSFWGWLPSLAPLDRLADRQSFAGAVSDGVGAMNQPAGDIAVPISGKCGVVLGAQLAMSGLDDHERLGVQAPLDERQP